MDELSNELIKSCMCASIMLLKISNLILDETQANHKFISQVVGVDIRQLIPKVNEWKTLHTGEPNSNKIASFVKELMTRD